MQKPHLNIYADVTRELKQKEFAELQKKINAVTKANEGENGG